MVMIHESLRYAHTEGHTDVCYTDDGKFFITVGADGDIRIWSTKENEDPIHNCIGEWALCVRSKNQNVYVATSSNDIQILTLPNGDRDGVLDRFVAPINHIAINNEFNMIALGGENMEIKVMNLDENNRNVKIFKDIQGPCLAVAISPDAKLLAASSGDGKLRVWNLNSNEILKEMDCFSKINSFANATLLCRIDFHPTTSDFLAYPSVNTVVILNTTDWSQVCALSCDEVTSELSIVQYCPTGQYLAASSINGDFIVWDVNTKQVVNHSQHCKSLTVCSFMWNPLNNGEIVYTDIEGQLSIITNSIPDDSDDHQKVDEDEPEDINELITGDKDFVDDDDEDNENVVSVEKLKRQYMGDDENKSEPELELLSRRSSPRPRTPEIPLQIAFMPSSTPEHLDPRYLCWNDVGVIRSYGCGTEDDETASKSIEVEFHDTTFHNSMMIPNYMNYTMGALSTSALVVANSSQIKAVPLTAASKEWVLKMEDHEEIVLIATSENLICCAMSNYIVRVCSIFGIQRAVLSVPGPLVSMNAFKNRLVIAYHLSGVRKGDQCINIKLITIEGASVISKDVGSALGPESTLQWLGFSDLGTPAMMDSLGMVSMFPHSCNIWIPYCDTVRYRSQPSDGFFVTTIFESYQAVGGIKCRGSVYPGFTPRPTICELPLEPPFSELGTDKTQMESNLFVWSTLQISNVEKKYKETALKIFALACKNDLDQRAMEYMEILNNPQILNLGIKYATKLEKRRLVEKLMSLAEKIAEMDDGDENETNNKIEMTISTPDPRPVLKPSQRLTLSAAKLKQRKSYISAESTKNTNESQNSDILTPSKENINMSSVNTQESLFSNTTLDEVEEQPKNPFLKNLKMDKTPKIPNPLSLTDRFAGVHYEKKTKEIKIVESEKRKQPESDTDKQKEKQRKLDKFMFSKRS